MAACLRRGTLRPATSRRHPMNGLPCHGAGAGPTRRTGACLARALQTLPYVVTCRKTTTRRAVNFRRLAVKAPAASRCWRPETNQFFLSRMWRPPKFIIALARTGLTSAAPPCKLPSVVLSRDSIRFASGPLHSDHRGALLHFGVCAGFCTATTGESWRLP